MADHPESTAPSGPPGGPAPAAPGAAGLVRLNGADPGEAVKLLGEVCASRQWIDAVAGRRPYRYLDELYASSDLATAGMTDADLDEAMAGHAVIGRPRAGDDQSHREQSGVHGAAADTLADLADANAEYAAKFGHVFLICARGRGAAEMLAALRARLGNDAATERANAREELRKINRLRLAELVGAPAPQVSGSPPDPAHDPSHTSGAGMTAISTHVLDTSAGDPAPDVPVELAVRAADGSWQVLGTSATDADGRCPDLPPVPAVFPAPATVRLRFDVAAYRAGRGEDAFFPEVQVVFTTDPARPRYHVPLLLNPYGYSVYRGS